MLNSLQVESAMKAMCKMLLSIEKLQQLAETGNNSKSSISLQPKYFRKL